MASEEERIARLAARFAASAPGVVLGIGDDAAVLDPKSGARLVWTIDSQVEDVHFRRAWLSSWEDLGYRAFMAAASDVAAMGASPWCALGALELPAALDDDAFDAIAEGQRLASREVGAPIVGGNISRGPVVAITTTLLGRAAAPIARAGAQPGDGVWIAGAVGLAAAGLAALRKNVQSAYVDPAVLAWRRPRARIVAGLAMAGIARAAVDVSDGLARDLDHLARASGVRAVVDAELLVAHAGAELTRAAAAIGEDPLDLALFGGEDYALVAASPRAIAGFTRIGEIRAGQGLALVTRAGERELAPRGFDHFEG